MADEAITGYIRIMKLICATAIFIASITASALADGDGYLWDQQHWMACSVMSDNRCVDTDKAAPNSPPFHYETIEVKYWPLDDAPCDSKVCHVPQMPTLKQVCENPESGEFSFDGRHFKFFSEDVKQYHFVAITRILRHGNGPDTTASAPACGIS